MFKSDQQSHEHSLKTLDVFYEHDDFMMSVDSVVDFGCGSGLDLEWWATRTTRDELEQPLNIKCHGVDLAEELQMAHRYKNIQYSCIDFEKPIDISKKTFDIAWCHDSFQFVINPFQTLKNWYNAIADDGMLILILPQSTNIEYNYQAFDQKSYCYYNWTLVSLIHVLAVSGFDCAGGFFLKESDDPWLHAIVYKSEIEPLDPRTTSWYDLADKNLLPDSAAWSLNKHGYVRQRDLALPWLDKSLHTYAKH